MGWELHLLRQNTRQATTGNTSSVLGSTEDFCRRLILPSRYLLLHKKRILTVTALLLNAVLFPDPFHLYNSYQHVTACRDISCACRNPPQPPHLALLRRTTPSRSHVVGPTKAQRTPSTSAMATPQRQRRAARAPSRRTRQVKVAAIGVHGAMHSHR